MFGAIMPENSVDAIQTINEDSGRWEYLKLAPSELCVYREKQTEEGKELPELF